MLQLHNSHLSDEALTGLFTARAKEMLAPFTDGAIPADVVANLLKLAMRDAHQAALAGATYQWRVDSKDLELPQHGWRPGNTYPSEKEARESAERDMRDAQLNGDEEGTSRYQIVPMTTIEGGPLPVRYIKPTTYQAWIRVVQGRATVCVDLVKPAIDDDAPYPRAEVALAETPIQIGTHRCSMHCEDMTAHADETLENAGWRTSVGWRDLYDMPDGTWYTFATKI